MHTIPHPIRRFLSIHSVPYILLTGLRNWQTAREAWCEKLTTTNGETTTSKNKAAVELDVDGVIDVLFDPRWRGGGGKARMSLEPPRFPTNVPLPQMIDVLTDLWEAEGLDV